MGTSIRIFLVNDTPHGLRYAEIGLSTVVGFVVPRVDLSEFQKRDEQSKTCVYILIGDDPNISGKQQIYIGETDNAFSRLSKHNEEKDFWTYAIVFYTKDQNLNKAHIQYLESQLLTKAKLANRATVVNTQFPEPKLAAELERSDMDKMVEQILILSPIFGLFAFVGTLDSNATNTISEQKSSQNELVELVLDGDQDYYATCILKDSRFIVQKGSKAVKTIKANSMQATYKNLRESLIKSKVLVEKENSYEFEQDYSFDAATPAAQIISGSTVSGRTAWKVMKTEQPYADWEKQQLSPNYSQEENLSTSQEP